MDELKTLEERKALLAKHVAAAVPFGARIESQSETMAVLVYGRRVNHILHFLLGFPTFGFWWLVWIFLAITGGEKRKVITVDDYGNVLEQGQGGGGSKLPVIGVGVLGLLLLVGIIAVSSSGTDEEPTDQVSVPTIRVAPTRTPLNITVERIYRAYQENEARANATYKEINLNLQFTVDEIEDRYVIQNLDSIGLVQAQMRFDQEDLIRFNIGDRANRICVLDGFDLDLWLKFDCR